MKHKEYNYLTVFTRIILTKCLMVSLLSFLSSVDPCMTCRRSWPIDRVHEVPYHQPPLPPAIISLALTAYHSFAKTPTLDPANIWKINWVCGRVQIIGMKSEWVILSVSDNWVSIYFVDFVNY